MFEGVIDLRAKRRPKPGEQFWCQDWQCPAHNQCRFHFGRSYDYAAMTDPLEMEKKKPRFFTPERFKYAPQCDRFERDIARGWLMGWCEPPLQHGEQALWCCTGCGAPECPRQSNVIQLFAARGVA